MRVTRLAVLLALLLSQLGVLGVVWAAPAPPARTNNLPDAVPNWLALPQAAPTLAPAPVATLDPTLAQDPSQETAAVIIIWAVIILVTAITLFLIWWTRPNRHPLRGRGN